MHHFHALSTGKTVFSIENLTVQNRESGQFVIDNASLRLNQGEFVCLLGVSGAGKTTMVFSAMGLLRSPMSVVKGKGEIDGKEIFFTDDEQLAKIRGCYLSIIFQCPLSGLNPVLPCGVQVEEPLKIHTDMSRFDRREKVMEKFRQLGFNDPDRIYRSLPSELSGGQIQRVALAIAIILEPQVLFADEPTTALDPASRDMLLDLLSDLREKYKMAVVLITHDLSLADKVIADKGRILTMEDGRLTELDLNAGSGRKLHENPIHCRTDDRQFNERGIADSKPVLQVRKLNKTYTKRNLLTKHGNATKVFESLSLDVQRGEVVGIMGASGIGKTTLGRCIVGLEMPDEGEIIIDGVSIADGRGKYRRGHTGAVQMIYQDPYTSFNPVMRVGEAIEENPRIRKIPKRKRTEMACCLLEEVGLSADMYSRFPKELSGGERQRVVIARALAADPILLVADEPTASLDKKTSTQVLKVFSGLAIKHSLSIICISHDKEVLDQVCDRVLVFRDGKLDQIHPCF